MTLKKIRVLIVDDSPVDRELLLGVIGSSPDLLAVGQAADAYEAREKINRLKPDVVTLDVLMPGLDGIRFLGSLMRLQPMPVVMCSAVTSRGAEKTLEALRLGAVDFIQKHSESGVAFAEFRDSLVAKLVAAAGMRREVFAPRSRMPEAEPRRAPGAVRPPTLASSAPRRQRAALRPATQLIAIGASTGGVSALETLLEGIRDPGFPPIVVTQHIPEGFSGAFARRLDKLLRLTIAEAEDDMPIAPGHVYIAPGGQQLTVERGSAGPVCRVRHGATVNRHCPSVETLFSSVALAVGPTAIGVMLTGMGADGVVGMMAMRAAGAYNLAQDEATSLVWGMPGAAVEAGATHEVLPLQDIAPALLELATAVGRNPLA
jgi:two-component system chemotaxis response regulator CheB